MIDKKSPNDYAQIKFRPGTGTSLESELVARAEQPTDSGYSQVAKRDLERLYTLYHDCLPTFSEDEAVVLVNALNGSKGYAEMAHRLYVDVQEYLEESETYSVPPLSKESSTFLIRLKALHRFECMAVIDAAERFWAGPYSKKPEEVQAGIRAVGLVK